jgi:tetratricopeptide (TPR) repeat protein
MNHNARCLRLLVIALAVASMTARAGADEPVEAFLDALRQRQMYDAAIDYLELLPGHPHLAENVKQRALYEQGATLLESALRLSDLGARETQLSKANELFAKFQTSFPEHELAAAAKSQSANILIERGRAKVELARQAEPKEPPLAEARELFEQARAQFTAAEKELDAQSKKFPKLAAEKDLQTQKRQVSGDLAQVRMLRAGIDYELAKTFAPHSADAKKHLKAAVQSFAAIDETYRTRAAGLLARLWEGRCYQEMGELKQALGCYQELMDLPTNPDTRSIKTKSTRQALECWTQNSEKKYPEAIERGERWEKDAGGSQTDPDALAIRYLTGLAYQAQSNALPSKDPNRKKLAGVARQYVGPVAEHPGEYQRPAKMLLVALGGNKDNRPPKESKADPATFAEAIDRGNQAREQVQETDLALKLAEDKSDKAAVENLKRQKKESTAAARQAYQLALTLSDKKTNVEELNSARWYLCYFAWDAGQYYDAAVMGEFLARRYPESLAGRKGSLVALFAYLRLYAENKAAEKEFEASRLQDMAQYMFKTWPEGEEADEAALTLLNFAASQKQLDKVLEYLAKVSATSPRRGQAELRAGQALWSAYLRGSQASPEERPKQDQLDQLKKQAQDVLATGISRMEKIENVDATMAAAVFALAQICVETGQPDKAIGWLEHPKLGSLTLVKSGSPLTNQAFAIESYKLALRAFVAVRPQQLKKAEEAMDALDKLVQNTGDAKAAENLTAIYISLGRELQQQLQDLRKSGKKNNLDAVSKAFEVFLDRVTKRNSGNSYAALNWVGETYYSLATGFDEGGPSLAAKAKTYFQKATTAYQRMIEFAGKDPDLKASENLIGVRLRLADCYQRAGKFDEAIKVLLTVLKEKPMLTSAQIQAAETYQAKGADDPTAYALALYGSTPGKDGKNVIWGWLQLSRLIENRISTGDPKFEESFHLARLNMAESRYRYSLTLKEKAKRDKILEAAKQDLWITYKLHPNLGGQQTAAKYDSRLKQVQKELGNKVTGLVEFKDREAAAEAAAAKK